MGRTRVIIYICSDFDLPASEAACLDYCDRRGYDIAALVVAGAGRGDGWDDGVVAMLRAGTADIVVVPHEGHLPPQRTPRIESADDGAVRQRTPRPGPVDR